MARAAGDAEVYDLLTSYANQRMRKIDGFRRRKNGVSIPLKPTPKDNIRAISAGLKELNRSGSTISDGAVGGSAA
jgi:hypothetical protein